MMQPDSLINQFEQSITNAPNWKTAVQFAHPFGDLKDLAAHGDIEKIDGRAIQKTIQECLAGLRPELQKQIWQTVLEAGKSLMEESKYVFYRSTSADLKTSLTVRIGKIDIEIARYMGLDLGTLILLRMIFSISEGPYDFYSVHVFGKKRKTSANLTLSKDASCLYMGFGVFYPSPKVTWDPPFLEIKDLPETIGSVLEGKKLSQLLSHPVFEKFEITISRGEGVEGNWDFETDYKITPDLSVDVIELAKTKLSIL